VDHTEIYCDDVNLMLFSFFYPSGRDETESNWNVGLYLAYCTNPGWYMMKSVEHLLEWQFAGEIEVVEENLPNSHFVQLKSHMTWPWIETGPTRYKAGD
jgi:hypothetical protein